MKTNINKPIEIKESLIAIGLFLFVLAFFSGCEAVKINKRKCINNLVHIQKDGYWQKPWDDLHCVNNKDIKK